jgi:hypothetical protein
MQEIWLGNSQDFNNLAGTIDRSGKADMICIPGVIFQGEQKQPRDRWSLG